MVPQPRHAAAARVALAVEGMSEGFAGAVVTVLAARGLATRPTTLDEAHDYAVIGLAPEKAPTPAEAAAMAPLCERAARAGSPVVLLAVWPRTSDQGAKKQAAALAYLRAFGAIIVGDPDVWIETIALIAGYGIPRGPGVAIVAPSGTWLAAAAEAMRQTYSGGSTRVPPILREAGKLGPADIALVDASLESSAPERVASTQVIPVVGRGELLTDRGRMPLVGLGAALGAASCAGAFAARVASGLGPGQKPPADLQPDLERFERQLDKLGHVAGDHESKVLLAAYGVTITRQAVATTPSAATRIAKKAGYPVEIKPWDPDLPSELDGCPVERGLATAADVRRAFAAVARAAGFDGGVPVIVRETPPGGREANVQLIRVGALGWTVIVEVAGALGPAAAPAPLCATDARALAGLVEASRAGDPQPDHEALADLLTRASYLVTDHDEVIAEFNLPRVIVHGKGDGAVVADAHAVLKS